MYPNVDPENESFLETLVMVSQPIMSFCSHLVKYQRTTRPDGRCSRMIKLSISPETQSGFRL